MGDGGDSGEERIADELPQSAIPRLLDETFGMCSTRGTVLSGEPSVGEGLKLLGIERLDAVLTYVLLNPQGGKFAIRQLPGRQDDTVVAARPAPRRDDLDDLCTSGS